MTAAIEIETGETETDQPEEWARLTADAVLFSQDQDGRLHVLTVVRRWPPFAGERALPGGLLNPGEETEDAMRRELREETGLVVGKLTLTGVYGAPGRDPRGRVVTWAYAGYAAGLPTPVAADDALEASWLRVDQVVSGAVAMAFDHQRIVREAVALGACNPGPTAQHR